MKTARDIERRIASLEVKRGEPLVVRVRVLTGELTSISCGTRQWIRQPGESADALRARATLKGQVASDGPLLVFVEHNETGGRWPLQEH